MATAPMPNGPDPTDPPRDFAAYDTTDHFDHRVSDPRRPVGRSLAKSAVEHGTVESNPVDRDADEWRFRRRLDGMDIVVPAGVPKHDDADRVRLFTAYADVANAQIATQSYTWDTGAVHVAALLQYLDGRRSVADANLPARDIHVDAAFRYKGHDIVLKRGHTTARCVKCGTKADEREPFDRKSCR